MRKGIIRPLALAIITHKGRILVMDGYDPKKDQSFFRILGGGIELGERGEVALKREFMEELNVELKNVEYLTTIENIFTFDGDQGHEIVLVYKAELATNDLYELESTPIIDSNDGHKAWWVDIARFKEGKEILYPESIIEYLL